MVVSTDEPGSTALDHFNVIDVIFEVRVPDCTRVFELWTDQAFLCSLFDFRLTVAEVPSQQAQCSVGLEYYLVDVAYHIYKVITLITVITLRLSLMATPRYG